MYPIWSGFLVGICMGEPIIGMQAGAYINLAYLGWITAGGTMNGNLPIAAVFGTVLTILSGEDPSIAIVFAFPVSLIGIFVFQFTMKCNVRWVKKAEKMLDNGNIFGMQLMNYLPSGILSLLIIGLPAFFLVYFGTNSFPQIFAMIPDVAINSFQIVGKVMPVVGVAMMIHFLGNKKNMVFYFLGFLLVIYLKLNVVAVAAFAAVLGVIIYNTGFLDHLFKGE
jgi:mannose/fructose/N-acetylgalactosamine-specific phosphotransferase system component IIC